MLCTPRSREVDGACGLRAFNPHLVVPSVPFDDAALAPEELAGAVEEVAESAVTVSSVLRAVRGRWGSTSGRIWI